MQSSSEVDGTPFYFAPSIGDPCVYSSSTVPLVYEAFNWDHGTFVGATGKTQQSCQLFAFLDLLGTMLL